MAYIRNIVLLLGTAVLVTSLPNLTPPETNSSVSAIARENLRTDPLGSSNTAGARNEKYPVPLSILKSRVGLGFSNESKTSAGQDREKPRRVPSKPVASAGHARQVTLLELWRRANLTTILRSAEFQSVRAIVMSELNKVKLPSTLTADLNTVFLAILRLDYLNLVKRLLAGRNPHILFPRPPDVNPECYYDLMTFVNALIGVRNPEDETKYDSLDWAIRMLDSFGKPGPGLLYGGLQFVGQYDECLDTHALVPPGTNLSQGMRNTSVEFDTRYCRVQMAIEDNLQLDFQGGASNFWSTMDHVPMLINWGICVPNSCYSKDVEAFLTKGTFGALGLPIEKAICSKASDVSKDGWAIFTISIFLLFGLLILVCTGMDVYTSHRPWFSHSDGCHGDQEEISVCANFNSNNNVTYEVDGPDTPSTEEMRPLDDPHKVISNGVSSTKDQIGHYGKESDIKWNKSTEDQSLHREPRVNNKYKTSNNRKPKHEENGSNNHQKKQTGIGIQLIKGFSFYSNLQRLLSTKSGQKLFHCVQGIRVLSMAWIILGHTFTFGAILDEKNNMFENLVQVPIMIASESFHIIGSAHLAVDTYFVLSGFLVMFLTLKMLEKKGSTFGFWIIYFIHRFWRLTPVYMMVMLTGTTLYDHLVQGPLKADQFEEFYQCREKWWSHLIYINNFYQPQKKCMSWTWFMAVDMQFYIVSPVFIYLVYKHRKVGTCVLLSLVGLSAASAFLAQFYHRGQFIMMDVSFHDYWGHVYTMPWVRIGAFAVGMLLALALKNHKEKARPIMSKPKAFLVWLVVIAVALILIFINHCQWRVQADLWSEGVQATYEALVRPVWSVCVAWVVYACVTGLGGIADAILSWKVFIPLSRLTYTVYLVHPIIITFVLYNRHNTVYMDRAYLTISYNYIGNLVFTYLFAVLFSLAFEVPMMNLENILLPSDKS